MSDTIDGKVRVLPKQDLKPQVFLPSDGSGPYLSIIRLGNCEILKISRRVAEELIALGLSYGN